MEVLKLPGIPNIVILPRATPSQDEELPPASLHLFYHRRVADVNDHLPKYSGYIKSQLALGYHAGKFSLFGS